MEIGIIITFNNNAKDIDVALFNKYIKASEDIILCFVDNASKDDTLDKLKELKELNPKKVSVVEVKQHNTNDAAKRAGARFMISNYSLKHIGFIDANVMHIRDYNINTLLRLISDKKDIIINYDKAIKNNDAQKPALFKNIFSILDYIKQLDLNKLNVAIAIVL